MVLLLVVVVVVVGPARLPRFAEQLGVWVRTMRGVVRNAKARVDEELGEQSADVDWASLDPRRYDPRRIVREALLDDLQNPVSAATTTPAPVVQLPASRPTLPEPDAPQLADPAPAGTARVEAA